MSIYSATFFILFALIPITGFSEPPEESAATISSDIDKQVEQVHQLAISGNVQAQFELSMLYWGYAAYTVELPGLNEEEANSREYLEDDFDVRREHINEWRKKQAFYWCRKAALSNHPEAQLRLAVLYRVGIGTEEDEDASLLWVTKASIKGYQEAQTELGRYYKDEIAVDFDYQQSVAWLDRAIEQDHPKAMRIKAELISDGVVDPTPVYDFRGNQIYTTRYVVAPEPKSAFLLYQRAAELGDTLSKGALARCYQYGHGTPKDPSKHLQWKVAQEEDFEASRSETFEDKMARFSAKLIPVIKNAEQGGARQPATTVDSKSEGNEKPQPESEGRSQ